jgi:Cdc6-like AAA superfamily ATPase
MDIDTRIRRRERQRDDKRLVLDYQALNPTTHIANPPGRGPVFERLLDHLDPVFDGDKPDDAVVWGPPGSGKSAVVSVLFEQLDEHRARNRATIHTSTRAQSMAQPAFVYLDTRRADSRFQLYHATLSALTDDDVPDQGVSTEELRSRLRSELAAANGAVVAADHVGESQAMTGQSVRDHFDAFGNLTSLLAIGRTPFGESSVGETIELPGYGQQVLIDILMTRASTGLASNVLTHRQAQQLAGWAGGNAHDALAALLGAADTADRAGRQRLTETDLETGMAAVPESGVPLGRVLSIPATRQRVLRELLDLPDQARESVTATTEALAARPQIDLSASTIRRFLYELAEDGIVERVQSPQTSGQGRPPSRVEPRFPTLAFERLYDMRARSN